MVDVFLDGKVLYSVGDVRVVLQKGEKQYVVVYKNDYIYYV